MRGSYDLPTRRFIPVLGVGGNVSSVPLLRRFSPVRTRQRKRASLRITSLFLPPKAWSRQFRDRETLAILARQVLIRFPVLEAFRNGVKFQQTAEAIGDVA